MAIALQLFYLLYCSLLSILMAWVPMSSHMQAMTIMYVLHYSVVAVGIFTAIALWLWRSNLNKALSFAYAVLIGAMVTPNLYWILIEHDSSQMGSSPLFILMPVSSIIFFIAAPNSDAFSPTNPLVAEPESAEQEAFSELSTSIDRHHISKD